jgi:RNA polymerase sigma-70 factor (ECF subfamily)
LLPDRAGVELLRGLRADDPGALEYIVRGATEPLAVFAAGYLRAPDVADDVVQHVFIRLWEERARLPESTRLRAYLYSAVRNRALDLLKHERVVARFRDTVRAELASAASRAPDGDDVDRERLFAAMASLSDRQREAVRLRYQAQLTVNEVATLLGLSIRGVERLLQRAIAVLRRAMGEGEGTIS